MTTTRPWRVSLHGGHSWPFCDHASGSLEHILEAACERGFATYGVTEHAPRHHDRYLYDKERELGWTVATLEQKFDDYFRRLDELVPTFAADLPILRGFECEVVPDSEWADITTEYRRRYRPDYIVGSVHFLADLSIDGPLELFHAALDRFGGLERLACAYYDKVAELAATLQPEVIGHLDLVRRNGQAMGPLDTPSIRSAARVALDEIQRAGSILDVNTAGYRKGLGSPYPAPWLVHEALERGIGLCFGDDSHSPDDVGAGIDEARLWLMSLGVTHVRTLRRGDSGLERVDVPLAD